MRPRDWFVCLFIFLMFSSSALLINARVIRVEIVSRQDVLLGKPFGSVGGYERITGRVFFSAAIANLIIGASSISSTR
jgi:hypothetical protein